MPGLLIMIDASHLPFEENIEEVKSCSILSFL